MAATVLLTLTLTGAATAATARQLHNREHRQELTLHRYRGTVRFFTHHPRQAHTAAGRRALRAARVWLEVVSRELVETRAQLRLPATGANLRALMYRTHPCLARIVDMEDRTWDPTLSNGGGHDPSDSYGLPQANPGYKMASAGADWRTNPRTQLRWMTGYVNGRYGGECQAWAFWQQRHWY